MGQPLLFVWDEAPPLEKRCDECVSLVEVT